MRDVMRKEKERVSEIYSIRPENSVIAFFTGPPEFAFGVAKTHLGTHVYT